VLSSCFLWVEVVEGSSSKDLQEVGEQLQQVWVDNVREDQLQQLGEGLEHQVEGALDHMVSGGDLQLAA